MAQKKKGQRGFAPGIMRVTGGKMIHNLCDETPLDLSPISAAVAKWADPNLKKHTVVIHVCHRPPKSKTKYSLDGNHLITAPPISAAEKTTL